MSKCKITGKVLVIQLGREDTQIVLMNKGTEILHSISVQTPAGAVEDGMIRNTDAVRNMLKAAIREEAAFRRVNRAVFTLCTSQVISETVTTPDLPDARLEKLLQANVDMYFPVDMHDYQLVWQRVGQAAKESGLKEASVQLWAIPTAMLARYYSVGNACGLSVLAVDYCGHSAATAVEASFSGKEKSRKKTGEAQKPEAEERDGRRNPETELHLTLEKDLIGMTFVQKGTVVFQRFIRCGIEPSYQIGEIAMMVEYFRTLDAGRGSAITLLASGTLSGDRTLLAELEDALGMTFAGSRMNFDARFALCMGAARTTLDFGIPALNKPGKARRDLQAQLWQYLLILAGGLVLIAVVMLLLSSRIVWKSDLGSLESTRQTLTIQAQKTNGFADNYEAYASKYASYEADWDTIFNSLRTYNDNLVLVLEELETILPENTSVTGMEIAAEGMNIKFACETKEEAAYLIMALRDMKYANLLGITDLQGGGIGPATSYGSGETEKAPTEGSSAGSNAIADLVASELTAEELANLAKSLNSDEIELLEKNYGKKPNNLYPSLAVLKDANTLDAETFFAKRKTAMTRMLSSNPFAVNRFGDMLMAEFDIPEEDGILLPLISKDLFKLMAGGGDLMKILDELCELVTRDEETLTASETLICTDTSDTDMERWYVYYLEVETGAQNAGKYPYLDLNKVAADLMDNGSFDTGDKNLDAKMNALISEDTRNLLKSLSSEQELGAMVSKYFTEGSSGYDVVDELINAYLENGTTGVSAVDGKIDAYLTSGAMDEMISKLVDKYLTTGTTGNTKVDALVEKYLNTGDSGNAKLNAIIDKYLTTEGAKNRLKDLALRYILNNGNSGNATVDKMIKKYQDTGTTGNPKVDAMLDEVLGKNEEEPETTGHATLDELIRRYNKNRTSGFSTLDSLFKGYKLSDFGKKTDETVPEPVNPNIPGATFVFTDEQAAEMFTRYLTDGTTGSDDHNKIVENYLKHGNTGDGSLNKKLNDLLESDEVKAQLEKLVQEYFSKDTSGNTVVDDVVTGYLLHGSGRYDNKKLGNLLKEQIEGGCFDEAIKTRLADYAAGTGGSEDDKPSGDLNDLLTMENLKNLVKEYKDNGTTNIAEIDALFNQYVKKGTTGKLEWDLALKLAGLEVKGSSSIDDALDKLTGNGSNASSGPQDTRVVFNAVLGYNEELMNAELIRKGLYSGDKVDKLEVDD